MLKLIQSLLLSLSLLSSLPLVAFNTFPGLKNDPDKFLGTIGQGQFTTLLNEKSAFSVLLETADHNYRINGSVGISDLCQKNRFKIGMEYLNQENDYTFHSGIENKWIYQIAIGGIYQYYSDFDSWSYLELGGYYSRAPGKELSPVFGEFIHNGKRIRFDNYNRVTGSQAAGLSAGGAIDLWRGAELKLALLYDFVHYPVKFDSDDTQSGIGGLFAFEQFLANYFKIDALVEVRSPLDYFSAGAYWLIPTCIGEFSLGISGRYVNGKGFVTDTKALVFVISYMDNLSQKLPCRSALGQWTAKPAIYMPQVLAIKDEHSRVDPF